MTAGTRARHRGQQAVPEGPGACRGCVHAGWLARMVPDSGHLSPGHHVGESPGNGPFPSRFTGRAPGPARRAPLQLETPVTWHPLCAAPPGRSARGLRLRGALGGWETPHPAQGTGTQGVTTPVFPPRLPGAVEAKASRAPFQGSSLQVHSHLSVPLLPHIPNAPQRRVGLTSWRGTGATSPAPGFGPPARANGQASRGVAVSPARPPRELSCSIQKCMLSGEPPPVPPARTPAAPGEGRLAGVPAAPIAFPAGREHSPSPLQFSQAARSECQSVGSPHATQSHPALGESAPGCTARGPGGGRLGCKRISPLACEQQQLRFPCSRLRRRGRRAGGELREARWAGERA